MSQTINDEAFGKMKYKHSWKKKESLLFLDKAYPVNIIAQAYSGDDIEKVQRERYLDYKNYLEEHKEEILSKLKEFCQSEYSASEPLDQCLTPTSVVFERDGSWGILFDTPYDEEHGVAMFVVNGAIKVGTQDLFL